ncbi:hypothetical protein ESY86_09650 [Subsaximicrobium wynnwilliamsii]|uniref:DUF6876 domain-containing protein n=1 Tax=Subsaximicrobium wynnwilliamsii TaxID=291179 RepID=A0A5C6ZIH2_9FLAO|nr:DUF6876 family protein [Subsaximicrobium wynnwilliamsii]TXD83431.1 hypothetical protein ESY87_09160 [Subsaximicrobium wynnwilliamsii]TXD89294.1 hypothetical protein ESY86_09650 [Subsaximicrobium wynnwilliamsii]TXE03111.1 hypothetical protein ESY88_08870 [Subsaximicrobium wynnwilliamsii]
MKTQANIILEGLKQFYGSDTYYEIPLIKTRYTCGIKYLAENANCYWLVSDASLMAKTLMTKTEFVTIDFKRLSRKKQDYTGHEAQLIYTDGNENVLECHGYSVSDFPLDELRLFFVNNMLMLPSEY